MRIKMADVLPKENDSSISSKVEKTDDKTVDVKETDKSVNISVPKQNVKEQDLSNRDKFLKKLFREIIKYQEVIEETLPHCKYMTPDQQTAIRNTYEKLADSCEKAIKTLSKSVTAASETTPTVSNEQALADASILFGKVAIFKRAFDRVIPEDSEDFVEVKKAFKELINVIELLIQGVTEPLIEADTWRSKEWLL